MLVYFKKYIGIAVVLAIFVPVLASFCYSAITGQILIESTIGKTLFIALFVATLLISLIMLERRAEADATRYIKMYNTYCDPEAMVKRAAGLAASIKNYNEEGAWFMGYYAQAALDTGDPVDYKFAKTVKSKLEDAMTSAKDPLQKARYLVNLVQLCEKMSPLPDCLALIESGIALLEGETSRAAQQRWRFLVAQKRIVEARMSENQKVIIDVDETVKDSETYPMRVRVEYAYDEAMAWYAVGNRDAERECLLFVAENGNRMSVAKSAIRRLEDIARQSCDVEPAKVVSEDQQQ